MNKNVKISLFCHNKYEIFLGCVHKIKVCAECSRFSIGFRHKQLKYNTWKPEANIVLHSVMHEAKVLIQKNEGFRDPRCVEK